MIKKQKREYDAPMVELIDARVEKGFQTSGASDQPQTQSANEALTFSGNSYGGNDFD